MAIQYNCYFCQMSKAEAYFNGHRFQNNLGSIAEFNLKNGIITGIYGTAVSANNGGEINGREIQGRYIENEDGVTLTFNVLWPNSVSCWNGKYYFGENEFRMNWLLNRNKPLSQEWESSNNGQDRFHRID